MEFQNNNVNHRMITIGGINIFLRSSYKPFWDIVDKRYQNFYTSEKCQADETIDIITVDDNEIPISQNKQPFVNFSNQNGILLITQNNSIAEWDKKNHYILVKQRKSDFLKPYADNTCNSYMKIVLSTKLLEMKGFLIHAAGIIKNEKGYLFSGKSGSGKTTISRISANTGKVLTDELAIVYLTETGVQLYGTPFFGEFGIAGPNISIPLTGIYFLSKAKTNQVLPITPQKAMQIFLTSIVFISQDDTSKETAIDLAMALYKKIPCCELNFLPDESLWRYINA